MFYVYHDGTHYIRVTKKLKLRRVADISKAAYWTSEAQAKTWRNCIYINYPYMKMKEATLTLK